VSPALLSPVGNAAGNAGGGVDRRGILEVGSSYTKEGAMRDRWNPETDPMSHWTVWVEGDRVEAVNQSNTTYKAYCVDETTYIEVGYCRYSEAIERAEGFGQVIEASSPY
jgi:hypothetical protein